jgi:hypothetical protein
MNLIPLWSLKFECHFIQISGMIKAALYQWFAIATVIWCTPQSARSNQNFIFGKTTVIANISAPKKFYWCPIKEG